MDKLIKIVLFFILILAILLNINWLKSTLTGLILSLVYFIIFGHILGKLFYKNLESTGQLLLGVFSLLATYSLLGAITYYFYQLNQLAVGFLFAIISITILILDFRFKISDFGLRNLIPNLKSYILNLKSKIRNLQSVINNPQSVILTTTYLILFASAIYTLLASQTSVAIHSPWQVIPKPFFVIYFLATLNLLLLFFKNKATSYNLILISAHFFLTTTVALLVYKLGYGFDPFIHQVTEATIFKNGFILPKPFYYLGQYSLVVILAHFFSLSVEVIDKLLLPLGLCLFLPTIIYTCLDKTFNWSKNISQITTLTFLLLPFSVFIATTPQALANLITIIILFLSFLYLQEKKIPFWSLIFLSLTALAIHALAGLASLIYLIIIWLLQNKNIVNKIILLIFIGLATLALPLALIINSFVSIYKIDFTWFVSTPLIQWPNLFARQYWYFLDLAYLYKNSIYIILVIATSLTLYSIIKHHKTKLFLPSIVTFFILLTNAIFLNHLKVSLIINYEQGDFANRIWQLAFYFLLPIVIYGLYLFLEKSATKPFIYRSFLILLLSLLLSSSLYLSYPRFDDYDNSKFINLSQDDLQIVEFIENNSQGQNYIVLANQMTSVAALKKFGFNRYYGEQYFYPIPTGGQLYQYFEKMLYQSTTKKTMEQAMELAGVKTAYFVLPSYWSRFKIITDEAKKEADGIYIYEDRVYIFKYTK